MSTRLRLVVCRTYEMEARAALAALVRDEGFAEVAIGSHADVCTHPNGGARRDVEGLVGAPGTDEDVLLVGACFMGNHGASAAVPAPDNVRRSVHCLHLVAPRVEVDELFRSGAYVTTPGWLSEWPDHLARWGFDRDTARLFFGEGSKRIVMLDTGVVPDAAARLAEFGSHVGLPTETRQVGTDHFRLNLRGIVLEWRLGNARSRATDHAVALDLLNRLARMTSEEEAVAGIGEMARQLFGARAVRFHPALDGNRPGPDGPTLGEGQEWKDLPGGVAVRVTHGDDTLGVLAIEDFAVPERKTEHLNLIIEIAGLWGLALANARAMMRIRETEQALRSANENLEETVARQVQEISDSQLATIVALARLAESRDDDTGSHIERVQSMCDLVGRALIGHAEGLDQRQVDLIRRASPLHDIGKVGVPDSILLKPGRLTPEEFQAIKGHTTLGARTLEAVLRAYPGNSFLHVGMDIARCHHERWDGTGYPAGLAGEAIPLGARIVAVADVYDALRSRRPYKEPWTHDRARDTILAERGRQFDPAVVDAFERVASDCARIRDELGD